MIHGRISHGFLKDLLTLLTRKRNQFEKYDRPPLNQIASYIAKVLPWSVPLKLAIGSILGVLGSAGLLGYLTEYATYSYAISYGIRPPLEGVSYLKASVALASIFILLSGAFAFIISSVFIHAVLWFAEFLYGIPVRAFRSLTKTMENHEKWFPEFSNVRARLGLRPGWQIFLISMAVGLLFAIIGKIEFYYLDQLKPRANPTHESAIYVMGLIGFFAALTTARPKLTWWLAMGATATNFIFCIGVLFNPTYYSRFLRVVGYGGGFPVQIELTDEPSSHQLTTAFLMIRTNESFIIYEAEGKRIVELPHGRVKSVSHLAGALNGRIFYLPGQ